MKYSVGDKIDLGNGITAEVLKILSNAYLLSFSSGIEKCVAFQNADTGRFSLELKYTGAVKDIGRGYKYVVQKVVRGKGFIVDCLKDDQVVRSGIMSRSRFNNLTTVCYDIGDTIMVFDVPLTIVDMRFSENLNLCATLKYEKFGTIAEDIVVGTVNYLTRQDCEYLSTYGRRVLVKLFGMSENFVICSDANVYAGGKVLSLADALAQKDMYEYKSYVQPYDLTAEEYLKKQEKEKYKIGTKLELNSDTYKYAEIVAYTESTDNYYVKLHNRVTGDIVIKEVSGEKMESGTFERNN